MKYTLLKFYASWCVPCTQLSRLLAELRVNESQLFHNITIIDINADNESKELDTYKIVNIPTLILLENGQVIKKNVGNMTKQQLISFLTI